MAEVFEVRQEPGELLLLPSATIHSVRNSGQMNFGVSTNYLVGALGRDDRAGSAIIQPMY